MDASVICTVVILLPPSLAGAFGEFMLGVGMNELSGMLDSGINSQCKHNMRIVWSTPRGGKYIERSTAKSRQFIRKSRKNHLLLFRFDNSFC